MHRGIHWATLPGNVWQYANIDGISSFRTSRFAEQVFILIAVNAGRFFLAYRSFDQFGERHFSAETRFMPNSSNGEDTPPGGDS
ncbi:hypothetical protein [Sinorhizobium sp. CCBAU 05631]|uniref:hypothetical protein n=1 Tax=Sinorhizobium sp. CCBAU 05631 TaxID=794846 RepID=UPI0004B19DD2|nr:hypothetical protein [Sinorhizobium sp. CCBAU 05631]